ncbi:ComEC family competence protein, partial [archaeon]|nr:ComEC family competence protein [archaeon]
MLLNHVGRETPLVVVFISICTGILVCAGDYILAGFSLIFLGLLFRVPLMGHMLLGMIIGYASLFHAPGFVDLPEGEQEIRGRVESSGFMRGNFRIVLRDATVGGRQIRGLVMLNVFDHVREIGKGCTLKGAATFTAPRALGNPGEFDYSRYLLTQGITLSGRIKDLDGVSISGPHPGIGLKDRLICHLSSYARPEAEILNAAIIGDRSGLVYSLQDNFSSLGITHLIAISGLNMGIVFFLGFLISFAVMRLAASAGFSYDTPLLAKASGLFCVILYAWFVGYSPPTTRAAIMVVVVVASHLFTRKPDLLESLSLAGIIILLWMPWSLYSVSFILSFSAVLGIIGLYQKGENLPGWFQVLAVPLVSMAFTSPVISYLFGFISPV